MEVLLTTGGGCVGTGAGGVTVCPLDELVGAVAALALDGAGELTGTATGATGSADASG